MVTQDVEGKIVFVSSVVGLATFAGYAAYSPSKFAIRALADTLRNELKIYNISTHCYFPGTILSPGFAEEEKTKPQITKNIEGSDTPSTPAQSAQTLIKGLSANNYHIASDLLGNVFRTSQGGPTPSNNIVWDAILGFVGSIIFFPAMRQLMDWETVKAGKIFQLQKITSKHPLTDEQRAQIPSPFPSFIS